MKLLKPALILALLAMALFATGMASAQGGHGGSWSGGHGGSWSGGHGGSWSGGHGGSWGWGHGGSWGWGHGPWPRSQFSFVIGGPVWGPWYYPYYPYYYPYYPYNYYQPVAAAPSASQVYIEPAQPAQPSTPSGVWYYCPNSRTYYPYVKECPGGWETIPAQPPSERAR